MVSENIFDVRIIEEFVCEWKREREQERDREGGLSRRGCEK